MKVRVWVCDALHPVPAPGSLPTLTSSAATELLHSHLSSPCCRHAPLALVTSVLITTAGSDEDVPPRRMRRKAAVKANREALRSCLDQPEAAPRQVLNNSLVQMCPAIGFFPRLHCCVFKLCSWRYGLPGGSTDA